MAVKKRFQSTFYNELKRTRIILDPYEMLGGMALRQIDPKALGIFIRLLGYAIQGGLDDDLQRLARLAGVSQVVMKRWWPEIEHLFERADGGDWRLRSVDWYRVQVVSSDRQPLRHLLDQLVAFWGNACVYCGTDDGELHIEHIVPVVRGGTDDLTNLTLACPSCNFKKRTQTAAEFGFPHIHEMAARMQ